MEHLPALHLPFFANLLLLLVLARVFGEVMERFKQPAETVANAIVRCLCKPKGEVWTSFPMRAMLALGTLAPGFADWMLLRRHRQVTGA
jgi:hypothetical protein